MKSVKLDEATKTLQTPKQSDVQVMMGGSNDLVNVLSGPEPGEAKRAPDSPVGDMYIPNFRKLQLNPSAVFESEMNKRIESFGVVLNYKAGI